MGIQAKSVNITISSQHLEDSTSHSKQYLSHLVTPAFPRLGVHDDNWILYIIMETSSKWSKPAWSLETTSFTTLMTVTASDNSPQSPYDMKVTFAKLPLEARAIWNRFVDEMQGRSEMEGKLVLMKNIYLENDSKIVVRVLATERPQ